MIFKRILFWIFIFIVIAALVIAGALVALERPQGQRWLLQLLITRYAPPAAYSVERLEGSPWRQWTLYNIGMSHVPGWPEDFAAKIQKLDLYFSEPRVAGINVEVHNGRLLLPLTGAVVIDGIYQDNAIDAQMYFIRGDLQELLKIIPRFAGSKDVRGIIRDFVCSVNGPMKDIDVRGACRVEELVFKNFSFVDGVIHFEGYIENVLGKPGVFGDCFLDKGTLKLPQGSFKVLGGKITFDGDWQKPVYDVRGEAVVDNARISMQLTGAGDKPELILTSEPSTPQEHKSGNVKAGPEERR